VNSKTVAVIVTIVLGIQFVAFTAPTSSEEMVGAYASSESTGGTYNIASDVYIETNYHVESLDVVDMNNDGANDLLVGGWNSLGGGIEIHYQTIPGAYSSVPDISMQLVPHNPNVAPSTSTKAVDANGDGMQDLAIVGWWNTAYRGAVYTQTPSHSFEFSQNLSPSNPHALEAGDVNGDGLADLLVEESTYISIFLRNATGGFSTMADQVICPYDPWPGYYIDEILTADLNEDGRLDVMMSYTTRLSGTEITGFRVALFYQPVGGWPKFAWDPLTETQPDVVLIDLPGDSKVQCRGMGVGDLNGDGHDDVATVVGNYYTNGSVNIFPFDASIQGISSAPVQTLVVGPPMFGNFPHHFDDLNQDGRDDLLYGYPVSIYYQMADGTISPTPGLKTTTVSCRGLFIADMDGDGDKDIVGADAGVNIWFDHATPPAPPSPGWSEPQQIDHLEGGDAMWPDVAMNDNGDAMAVWSQREGDSTSIWASKRAAGEGWRGPAHISPYNTANHVEPDVAMDASGNAVAVWWSYLENYTVIFAGRYTNGVGWDYPKWLDSSMGGGACKPQVVCDDAGNALAVWINYGGLMSSRYAPGQGWGPLVPVTSYHVNAQPPDLAMDSSGNVMAVWSDVTSSTYNIWSCRYVVGSGWQPAVMIETDDAGHATSPRVAVDDAGDAIAVWQQMDGPFPSTPHVFANRYAAGTGWGTAQLLETEQTDDAWNPTIGMDGYGNAVAAWYQYNQSAYRASLWTAKFLVSSGWTQADELVHDGCFSPDIAVNHDGHIVMVWLQWAGIEFSRCTIGSAWETPHVVSYIPSYGIQNPKVAIDSNGNATAVWFLKNALRYAVYGAGYVAEEEIVLTLEASVDIDPDAINTRSMNKWITAYIKLPDGYGVRDIQIDTVKLNGQFPATGPSEVKDFDKDKQLELMVKFDWQKANRGTGVVGDGTITFTVSGQLTDGTTFEGSDVVKTVQGGRSGSAASSIGSTGDWPGALPIAAMLIIALLGATAVSIRSRKHRRALPSSRST
jgi:FG-GAP-like repeat